MPRIPSTFARFILSHKNDDCRIADLARDMAEDTCMKRTWGYKSVKKHLLQHNACDGAMETLEIAWAAYQQIRAAPASPAVLGPQNSAQSSAPPERLCSA